MTTFRTVIATVACASAVITACGGSDDTDDRASEDTPPATTAATAATDGDTTDIETDADGSAPESTTTTTAPPPPPEDWAEQILDAFETYDQARVALDEAVGPAMVDAEDDQDVYDVFADLNAGMADAGDELTASMPPAVPRDFAAPFDAMLVAHMALVDQLRSASAALRKGDTDAENELPAARDSWDAACAELQFALLDLGAGLLACGLPDPTERRFEKEATVGYTDDLDPMPAEAYELGYIGEPEFPELIVGLVYESDRFIRSSIEVLEIADSEDGPSIRLHANELVADPTQLAEDRIANFWFNTDGPGPWLGALEGVVVTATGTGEISGLAAEYWDVVSEREAPIAILGDGDDWVPETTLDPGQPVRVWAFVVGGRQMVLTEHVPAGAELADFEVELTALRDGLSLSTG